jgi:mitochondrial fission protein ELM1
MTLTAWALTTGESGMRTQARGLAQAVADIVVEKTVRGRLAWPWAPPLAAADALAPPWPDILVSCGRRSAARAARVKRASGGRTVAVHVQDPRIWPNAFDLVVAMDHDRIAAGGKVIKVATALHDLTPENLEAAARAWAPRFAPLGRPLVGVVVGGDLKGRPFTLADGRRLIAGIDRLRAGAGAGLAITPSRRTPPAVLELLEKAYGADPRAYLWDLAGDNPYRGILALADRLIVTSDSVSMVSEALSAPHPVEIFDLGFPRHAGFIQGLVDARRVRRFDGDPSVPPSTGPVNATDDAARAVRALLAARGVQTRTGVSG